MPRYRLSGIRTRAPKLPDAPLLGRLLGVSPAALTGLTLVRRSLDARKKPDLFYESAVEFETESALPTSLPAPLVLAEAPPSRAPELLLPKIDRRAKVAVVGTGPAGLFAALALADAGAEVTVFERGDPAEDRYRKVMRFWTKGDFDPESNVQFGEGGAGTFSDGKLTCGKRHDKIAVVLETLHRFGAPDTILYDAKPHIGTDRLVVVLRNIRRHLLESGASLRYRAKVVDVVRAGEDGPLAALRLADGDEVPCDLAVFALGHSARDTVEALRARGVAMSAKAFAMGVRIEHPQEKIDLIQFGRLSGSCDVFPADYKLSHLASNGRGVYTFCMCPGGEVIACSSEAGGVVTNGMSRYKRASGFANAGLVVQTKEEDFASEPGPAVLRGQAFQRRVEEKAFQMGGGTYAAPAIRVTDFLKSRTARLTPRELPRTTYGPAAVPRLLDPLYPAPYLDALAEGILAFDRKMKGFVSDEALLIAPESRTSSPVRIDRDEFCESSLPGLYPAGEGAGFAGGIVSAALDGLRVARAVRARLTGETPVAEKAAPVGAPEY
ncbi:MAG TPA: NAD(P)/FAD-dependent oxidoreductase [Thermoanaerobaculia bacterium]|nr:NAD(P)/FAD-dependent oxidoreductase [Thermoanaerobaculia bacterium]